MSYQTFQDIIDIINNPNSATTLVIDCNNFPKTSLNNTTDFRFYELENAFRANKDSNIKNLIFKNFNQEHSTGYVSSQACGGEPHSCIDVRRAGYIAKIVKECGIEELTFENCELIWAGRCELNNIIKINSLQSLQLIDNYGTDYILNALKNLTNGTHLTKLVIEPKLKDQLASVKEMCELLKSNETVKTLIIKGDNYSENFYKDAIKKLLTDNNTIKSFSFDSSKESSHNFKNEVFTEQDALQIRETNKNLELLNNKEIDNLDNFEPFNYSFEVNIKPIDTNGNSENLNQSPEHSFTINIQSTDTSALDHFGSLLQDYANSYFSKDHCKVELAGDGLGS